MLTTDEFIELFLMELSTFNIRHINESCAIIPFDYDVRIENILFFSGEWADYFSNIVDIYSYYDDNSKWNDTFAKALRNFVKKNNLSYNYDYDKDLLKIYIDFREVNKRIKKYDFHRRSEMINFCELFNNDIFGAKARKGFKFKFKRR